MKTSHFGCGSPAMMCGGLEKSPCSSLPSHIYLPPSSFLLSIPFEPPTLSFLSSCSATPSSVSPNGLHYISALNLSCPEWIMGLKPRVNVRGRWDLQQIEGKLHILGYYILSSRYDIVCESGRTVEPFSVLHIHRGTWKCSEREDESKSLMWKEVQEGDSKSAQNTFTQKSIIIFWITLIFSSGSIST